MSKHGFTTIYKSTAKEFKSKYGVSLDTIPAMFVKGNQLFNVTVQTFKHNGKTVERANVSPIRIELDGHGFPEVPNFKHA